MVIRLVYVVVLLMTVNVGRVQAIDWSFLDPVALGARFQYRTVMDRASVPFPWNTSTRSAEDLTRLMVDLKAIDTGYGDLYLKAAAIWEAVEPDAIQKPVRLEQGDYNWHQELESLDYGLRLFFNERRFFVYDMTDPLLADDLMVQSGRNRGIRLDAAVRHGIHISAIHSKLGHDTDRWRTITYLKGAYAWRPVLLSASYLLDDPGANGTRNQAVFKTELSATYRLLYGILSYQQSGAQQSDFFFPDGGSGGGLLPDGSRFVGELRIVPIPIGNLATGKVVYRYHDTGKAFIGDFAGGNLAEIGHRVAGYLSATEFRVDARVLYRSGRRTVFEEEERNRLEGGIWGHLKGGGEVMVRGGIGETRNIASFDDNNNFIHMAFHHETSTLRTGAHVMWTDLDEYWSETRFAWDGRIALSANWGFHWRTVIAGDYDLGQSVFARLEYRPDDRIFATLDYGQSFIGDDPFLLEDPDVSLARNDPSVFSISLRGDF